MCNAAQIKIGPLQAKTKSGWPVWLCSTENLSSGHIQSSVCAVSVHCNVSKRKSVQHLCYSVQCSSSAMLARENQWSSCATQCKSLHRGTRHNQWGCILAVKLLHSVVSKFGKTSAVAVVSCFKDGNCTGNIILKIKCLIPFESALKNP